MGVRDPVLREAHLPAGRPRHEYLGGRSVARGARDASVAVPQSGELLFAKWKDD